MYNGLSSINNNVYKKDLYYIQRILYLHCSKIQRYLILPSLSDLQKFFVTMKYICKRVRGVTEELIENNSLQYVNISVIRGKKQT